MERLQGELTVYIPRTENYHVLNATAAAVWDLATGDHTMAEMLGLLADAGIGPGVTLRLR